RRRIRWHANHFASLVLQQLFRDGGLGGGDDHVRQRLIFLRGLLLLAILVLVVRGWFVLFLFLRGLLRRRRHGCARGEHEQGGKGGVLVRCFVSPGESRGGASGANREDRRSERVNAERRGRRAKACNDFVGNFDACKHRPRRCDFFFR